MNDLSDWLKIAIALGVYPPQSGGGGSGITAQQVQRWAFNSTVATGVDDAFIVNLSPAAAVLTDGMVISMAAGVLENTTNTPTLQVNALPPKDIVLWSGQLAPGDITVAASYLFVYSLASDTFQLINPSVSVADTFGVQANIYNSAVDSGSANAYEVDLSPPHQGSFNLGFSVYFLAGAGNTNTGASTIRVDSTTVPIVKPDGAALDAGNIVAGRVYWLLYNTNYNAFTLQNPTVTVTPPSPGLLPWNTVLATTQTMAANNGYIAENPALTTFTLPAVAPVGTVVAVQGQGFGGWMVQALAGGLIIGGTQLTTSGGAILSASGSDSVFLLCTTANSTWRVTGSFSTGLDYI